VSEAALGLGLGAGGDIEVVGEAATAAEALELTRVLRPDVALLDMRLPDRSGVEVVRQLREEGNPAKAVLLSAFDDEEYVMEALSAGAAGYLVKTMPSDELAGWVRRAADGDPALEPRLAVRIARYVGRVSTKVAEPVVSSREITVLRLLARGLPNKQIARRLGIPRERVADDIVHASHGKMTNLYSAQGYLLLESVKNWPADWRRRSLR